MHRQFVSHPQRYIGGFSLVEVTLAIGVVAFSLVGLLGLLPVGLNLHHQAMEASVSSQIVQQVVSDIQQADFSLITDEQGGLKQFPVRYFDEQGMSLGDAVNPAGNSRPIIYHVGYGVRKIGASLACVTIDILDNPGNKPLERDPANGGVKSDPGIGISPNRFSVSVAKSR